MGLSWSYDLGCWLGRLTQDFCPSFSWFFFQFHPSISGWLELSFTIYFGLCFMSLPWFHDLSHEFDCLTWVVFYVFFLIDFFIYNFTLGWLIIEFHNLFWFSMGFVAHVWRRDNLPLQLGFLGMGGKNKEFLSFIS